MSRTRFEQRSELFGLNTADPWSYHTLRLLCHVPRVFEPLITAWAQHHPEVGRAVERLVAGGWVATQPDVIVDVRDGSLVPHPGRPVPRYRITAKGKRLLDSGRTDLGWLLDEFPRLREANAAGVLQLLAAVNVPRSRAPQGVSAGYAVDGCGLSERTGRWWMTRLTETGHVRLLPEQQSDRAVVVPQHWRVTRQLCRQVRDVLDAYPDPHGGLRAELRLHRSRFLPDISLERVGVAGNTDFDHDVEAQRVLGGLLRSPDAVTTGAFGVEPRLVLDTVESDTGWVLSDGGPHRLFYQPDAFYTERVGTLRRGVLEYERFQSRRDAWSHIERLLAYLAAYTLPFEAAVLRFVTDTEPRMRGYVQLIEAFADYAQQFPGRMPPNPVQLAVADTGRVAAAAGTATGLHDTAWFTVPLPRGQGACVIHHRDHSPYDTYFSVVGDDTGPDR